MAPRPTPSEDPSAEAPHADARHARDGASDDPLRARLARRDPADWPWILGELRTVAAGVAHGFRDVCSDEDALGELALRTHERWLEDWLENPLAPPLRLFLRDRLRDHLRELRRRNARRAALLSQLPPDGPDVEPEGGQAHKAIFASRPPAPDEALEAADLHRAARAVAAGSAIIDLRAAGFDQGEIAERTGMSRPTVGRRLAAIAAVLAAIGAAGLLWALLRPQGPDSQGPDSQGPDSQVVITEEPHALTPTPAPRDDEPARVGGPAPSHVPTIAPERVSPERTAPQGPEAREPAPDAPAVTQPASRVSPEQEAYECFDRGDYACVIRVLDGHARSARQLGLLVMAQRELLGDASACPTALRLIENFPASSEAARFRTFAAETCHDH